MRRRMFVVLLSLVLLTGLGVTADELRFYLRSEPKTFNPGWSMMTRRRPCDTSRAVY
jgi:hypothetical protein